MGEVITKVDAVITKGDRLQSREMHQSHSKGLQRAPDRLLWAIGVKALRTNLGGLGDQTTGG